MMAAFVEQEWGEKAYTFHRKIKALFDPKGLINPGVIINNDKEIHSKNLTLTPRQRIAVHKEIKRLKAKKRNLSLANFKKAMNMA